MLIMIKKKTDSNCWNYPLALSLFANAFRVDKSLIVENNSGKSLEDLSILAGYEITEYVGEVPYIKKEVKLLPLGDIINILPVNTKRLLENIRDNADYSNTESTLNGDTAGLILSFLTIGDPINVNSENFKKQCNWMISNLDVTQEHIDTIKS